MEVMVVERMAWPSRTGSTRARGGGGDGGGSLWVARAIALALAATVVLGLWMTHYLDPGVIPPKATIVTLKPNTLPDALHPISYKFKP
jgi:hypothetical protein